MVSVKCLWNRGFGCVVELFDAEWEKDMRKKAKLDNSKIQCVM